MKVSPENIKKESWQHGEILIGVDSVEIPLGEANWFGLGALRKQHLDLKKLSIPLSPLISADPITPGLGETGFLGILEPFWFSSEGFGIYVETEQLIKFSFNAPLETEEVAGERPYLSEGLKTDGLLKIFGKNLTIRVIKSTNPVQVLKIFHSLIKKAPPPPLAMFEKPLWTTWANFKNNISDKKILEYALEIKEYGFDCSVFGIDAKWQKEFGDTSFDKEKFPNPKSSVNNLHELGYEVTLWNVPFFNKGSENFQASIDKGLVLKNASDESPYIGKWWEGEAAFLDLTNPDSVDWHLNNLQKLADDIGFDGFKFDAGEAGFYMDPKLKGFKTVLPQLAGSNYIKKISETYPWSDARTGWRTQDARVLLRQWDKGTKWGIDNGLQSCITQTIVLNMLGYRYNFPDMICGNEYAEERANEEMMIRWTQATAPLPFVQFSIPPWRYGNVCAEICRKYMELHKTLAPLHRKHAEAGEPLVCPLWWIAPNDPLALKCEDQYLICGDILVAPVMSPGALSRDIYLPEGQWRNYWNEKEKYSGATTLRKYKVGIGDLPIFKRL
jgi:alpha-glucosidase (family GH31 glycosyl hydrolase)